MLNKPVKIKMVSKVDTNAENDTAIDEVSRYTDSIGPYADAAEDAAFILSNSGAEDGNPVVSEYNGIISQDGDKITLEYLSHLASGFPTVVTYKFDVNKREFLTVCRRSIFERVYFFEKKCKRQVLVYKADNMDIELCIYTKKLKNNLYYEDGGYIEIEYYVEMRGGSLEHCKEYLLIESID